jgi:co-chaperonin GroES (HSP10)
MSDSRHVFAFVPLGDWLLIRRDELTQKGRLEHTPDARERHRPATGVVLSVGADCKHLKVGDAVAFMMYGGVQLLEDSADPFGLGRKEGEQKFEYRCCREPEIYGYWREGEQGKKQAGQAGGDPGHGEAPA